MSAAREPGAVVGAGARACARDVNGVKFPFAIEEERDAPGQTFVFYTKKIEVNVPIDDAIFKMPT